MLNNTSANSYRKDIQGIRALGASLIMIFHIWVHKVSGGVDVFFVISGYLMTSVLAKNFYKEAVISPFKFWAKIALRVFPSAYIVLLFTTVLAIIIFPPTQLMSTLREIMASALHVENIQLILKSVDYLSMDTPASAVQQFWALSIQMQFYFILPIILLPILIIAKRFRRYEQALLMFGVAILAMLSFLFSVTYTQAAPNGSYFHPLSRMWEFLLGSLLFWFLYFHPHVKSGNFLSVLGFLLILSTAFIVPKSANFPGYIALIPTLGAAMLIFSGSNNSTIMSRLLASRPLVYVGGLSFTIYLWHWPLLVFYKSYYDVKDVGILSGITIIVSSILLAVITTKIIEAPIKNLRLNERMSSFSLLALITVFFAMPVLIFSYSYFYSQDKLASESFKSYTFDMASASNLDDIAIDKVSFPIGKTELISAKKFLPSTYTSGCHQHINKSYVNSCEYGDLRSNKLLVVVGGSHIAQWLPAFNLIGTRNGYKVISITKSDCPFGIVPKSNDSCIAWNKSVLEEIISMSPHAVITNSTRTTTTNEYVPLGYVEQWKALSAKGIGVIGIRDNPRFTYDVPDCIYKKQFGYNGKECSKARASSLEIKDPSLVYSNLLAGIDMNDMLCSKTKCPVTNQGMLMYRDAHHIHLPYVMYLSDILESRLLSSL